MKTIYKNRLQHMLALLLTFALLASCIPVAFASDAHGYRDPAKNWLPANNFTSALDLNAIQHQEISFCYICNKSTLFTMYRVPEYTRSGESAMNRNVLYSNGICRDEVSTGALDSGTPGKTAFYTGNHWSKSVCNTCGTLNANQGTYEQGKDIYRLNQCSDVFNIKLDPITTYENVDGTYHKTTVTRGEYCGVCYGTTEISTTSMDRHVADRTVVPQLGHQRFKVEDGCALCDYTDSDFVAAKSVITSYYGVADGQPHTLTVSDLSEPGVRTSIRYGNSANNCNLTSAPNYSDAGDYTVYYEITYTYDNVDMVEDGVAYIWLRDESTSTSVTNGTNTCGCGCGGANCSCVDRSCGGTCCNVTPCGEDHNYTLVDTVAPTCTELGYDRYLCVNCGRIEKRDYKAALGHNYEYITVREATCETDGKKMEICQRCGVNQVVVTEKTGHNFKTYTVPANCTDSGYTAQECQTCGQRHITDLTPALTHDYTDTVTLATCETGGHTLHRCNRCDSSFISDRTEPLGHSWDAGTIVSYASCTSDGMMEYRCTRCDKDRLEAIPASLEVLDHSLYLSTPSTYAATATHTATSTSGHVASAPATCTTAQVCLVCGAVIQEATGHSFWHETVPPACDSMGWTNYYCISCDFSYKADYVDALGHQYTTKVTEPTCDEAGYTTYTCDRCGDSHILNYREALGHVWDSGKAVVNSTCNGKGMTEYRCSRCDTIRLENQSATGHTPGKPATCTEPQVCTVCNALLENAAGHHFEAEMTPNTCTEMGFSTYICADCGLTYKADYTKELGHNYTKKVTAPTCLEGGYTTYTCDRCGDSYVADQTDALGHAWDGGKTVVNSTCNGKGMTEYRCAHCNEVRLESESATGHTPGAPATCTNPQVCTVCNALLENATGHHFKAEVTPSTCTEIGFTTYICEDCGSSYNSDYTKELGHHYVGTVTKPTCLADGYTTYTCDHCGDFYVADETDALGHAWDDGTMITSPTCNGAGVTEYRCVRCDERRLDAKSAAGHTPGASADCVNPQLCTECGAVLENAKGHNYEAAVTAPTCTKMGFTTYTCADCGDSYDADYTEATGHEAGEWKVDRAPTLTAEGSRHTECVRCGETLDTEVLEKIYSQATTDSKGEGVVGEYLVIVTDTSAGTPVDNALVTLSADGSLSVQLPDQRLLRYDAPTTVAVLLVEDKNPVAEMPIVLTDKNGNIGADTTGKTGTITLPLTKSETNSDGTITVGYEDNDENHKTVTVEVVKEGSRRPIEGAQVTIRKDILTITLPDGTDLLDTSRVTVQVTDENNKPVNGFDVLVKGDLDQSGKGQTNRDGILTLPETSQDDTQEPGNTVVGQYTVIVTDQNGQPISDAAVSLVRAKDTDTFTVRLPEGRTLDAKNQTIVTVLLPDGTPAVGRTIRVEDVQNNHATLDTDEQGQVKVPAANSSNGDTIGTEQDTINVEVLDKDGKPVNGADVSINKDGDITILLPDGTTLEENPVTVIVTDNEGNPKPNVNITIDDGDSTAVGETGTNGNVMLPGLYHFAYINGFTDGTVRPEQSMTRSEAAAMFARILAEARGDDLDARRTTRFPDVAKNAWYYDYVAYLDGMGVILGYDDGRFHGEDTITRSQFVTMCVRLDGLMEVQTGNGTGTAFPDVPATHWAYRFIAAAARNGWVIGADDGKFYAENLVSRAQAVTILNRIMGRVADETYIWGNQKALNTFSDLQNPHYWAYYDMMEAANGHRLVSGKDVETWLNAEN